MAVQAQDAVRQPYSTAKLKASMSLKTEQAKMFGESRFDNMAFSLFVIDVTTRKRAARNGADHKAVAAAVSKKFVTLEKEIKEETERLETFLKSNKVEVRAEYSNPLKREFEITSPEVKRVSDLLVAFDNLIGLLDTAWLMQMIETTEANTFRQEKTRAISKFMRSIMAHAQAAKAIAFKGDDKETKDAIDKAEAQLPAEARDEISQETGQAA